MIKFDGISNDNFQSATGNMMIATGYRRMSMVKSFLTNETSICAFNLSPLGFYFSTCLRVSGSHWKTNSTVSPHSSHVMYEPVEFSTMNPSHCSDGPTSSVLVGNLLAMLTKGLWDHIEHLYSLSTNIKSHICVVWSHTMNMNNMIVILHCSGELVNASSDEIVNQFLGLVPKYNTVSIWSNM